MTGAPILATSATLTLASPDATAALAMQIAARLWPGDTILLEGPIGAGKSHFCRALIQALLAKAGRAEDVPSPTFTLVQVYELADCDIWHVDLYRLTSGDQVQELGLDEAFQEAIVLVEWPDRLGHFAPANALTLRLTPQGDGDARIATLLAADPRWLPLVAELASVTT